LPALISYENIAVIRLDQINLFSANNFQDMSESIRFCGLKIRQEKYLVNHLGNQIKNFS
jgi:hypothetical protein